MPKRYYCPHCKKRISKTLYYEHKRLFYNVKGRIWSADRVFQEIEGSGSAEIFALDSNGSDSQSEDNQGLSAIISNSH